MLENGRDNQEWIHSVLLDGEGNVYGGKHRPSVCQWQNVSHNVVLSTFYHDNSQQPKWW
jgi:hypothetical protein